MTLLTERRRRRQRPPGGPPHGESHSWRELGLSVVTGAADDDPAAVGTYANAGAAFGPAVLWTAPALFPLVAAVVYLAAKLGQVSGQGLAAILRVHFPSWVLWLVAAAVVAGNTFEAAADLGGAAAALQLLVPAPMMALMVPLAAAMMAILWFGSYTSIRAVFRWLALALLGYVISGFLVRPDLGAVVRGTLIPHLRFDRGFLTMIVAMIGTTLSPYLYIWQASQEVEEDVSMGRRRLSDRKGTSVAALRNTAWDVTAGMFFSTVVMYFIILSTGVTLYPSRWGQLSSAAEVARALQPLAGSAAGALFALGIIGVGFLAVPVMSVGAGYVVCDAMGWKSGLTARPAEAPAFYAVIGAVTAAGAAFGFLGLNPMRVLVAAGVVQGLLAPGLLLLLMLATNRRAIMGPWVNRWPINLLGWLTTALVTAAALTLIAVSI